MFVLDHAVVLQGHEGTFGGLSLISSGPSCGRIGLHFKGAVAKINSRTARAEATGQIKDGEREVTTFLLSMAAPHHKTAHDNVPHHTRQLGPVKVANKEKKKKKTDGSAFSRLALGLPARGNARAWRPISGRLCSWS